MKDILENIIKELYKTEEGKKSLDEIFEKNKLNDSDGFIQIKKKGSNVSTKLEGNLITLLILLNETKKSILKKINADEELIDEILKNVLVIKEDK